MGTSARAEFVQYFTTGVFTGGTNTTPGTSTFTSGGLSLAYVSFFTTGPGVDAPSQTSLGTFDTSGTAPGTLPTTIDGTFTLTITEISPASGSGNLSATLSGRVGYSQSIGAVIVFTTTSVTIGSTKFTVINADGGLPGGVSIEPTTTNNGDSTINGFVSVPEPGAMALLGIGGSTLLAVGARRRLRVAA
jgi:hypothetical protein